MRPHPRRALLRAVAAILAVVGPLVLGATGQAQALSAVGRVAEAGVDVSRPPASSLPADAEGGGAAGPEEPDPFFAEGDPLFDDGDDEDLVADSSARDPWEGFNRGTFAFNRGVDYVLFDPITRGYQFAVPAPGRRALQRVFLNLDTPVVLVNQIFQLRVRDAASTLGRFVINSTVGVAGLFDAAAEGAGILRTEADFGQTLAFYGTPSGPYLVLPILGPSTVRDTFGDVIDALADPLTYLIGPFEWWTLVVGGGEGLVVREANIRELEALEEGSIDFYSALRSAYLQSRDAAVREVRDETPQGADVVMLRGD